MRRSRRETIASRWNGANLADATSSILALLALVLLGLQPLWSGAARASGEIVLLWSVLEGSFLLPLLPGLLAGWPPTARVAAREAQVGAGGRALIALALGAALALGTDWSLRTLPGHALVVLAASFALPAALGWGPFGALPGLDASSQAGAGRSMARLARGLRWTALLATTLTLMLPLPLLPPIARPALLAGALLLALLALRQLSGRWPRLTLPAALRFCWQRGLPLGIAAIIYAGIISTMR
jgi:hypothetical protein